MFKNKRGQVTIFIIIAILIVSVSLAIIFIPKLMPRAISPKFQPIENYYQECVSEKVKQAVETAGMQAGYLELPEFEPGSQYRQFSNYYTFLGMKIPYWYYVSGNNLVKEQVPEKTEIESQFEDYLSRELEECEDFSAFANQGFDIDVSESKARVSVKINEDNIESIVNKQIKISDGKDSAIISSHKVITKTNFGLLYSRALEIYSHEKDSMFLENYTIDTLYLNAPVTGFEISCAPKIWMKEQVKNDLKKAIAANIGQVKVKGTYYSLASNVNKYFVIDTGKTINENVNFLATEPYRIEIWPSEDTLLKADPVGLQAGLNLIGFCYVPYHFVYDIDFPVLVQISKGSDIFQFPVAIVIDKTVPRKAELGEIYQPEIDICSFKGVSGSVYVYDENNNPVEADISFKCIEQICPYGKTQLSNGKQYLVDLFPQCLNGFIIAKADGYATAKVQVSSNEPFSTSIYMKKIKKLSLEADIADDESAIITFSSPEHSTTVFYPSQKEIELISTEYQVNAQLFKEGGISIPAETSEKCVKVPDWLGIMHEQCYTQQIPATTLTNVISGGGTGTDFPDENELSTASKLRINIPKASIPKTLEQLQDVYSMIEISKLEFNLS